MRLSLPETLRSFVFIDILALFPQNAAFSCQLSALSHSIQAAADPTCGVCDVPKGQLWPSGSILPNCAFGVAQTFRNNLCASQRLFVQPFVFIDILALFRRFS